MNDWGNTKMGDFFSDYPKTGFWILSISLSIIGALSMIVLSNNTQAMRDLKEAIDGAIRVSHQNEVAIGKHEERIVSIEKRVANLEGKQ